MRRVKAFIDLCLLDAGERQEFKGGARKVTFEGKRDFRDHLFWLHQIIQWRSFDAEKGRTIYEEYIELSKTISVRCRTVAQNAGRIPGN